MSDKQAALTCNYWYYLEDLINNCLLKFILYIGPPKLQNTTKHYRCFGMIIDHNHVNGQHQFGVISGEWSNKDIFLQSTIKFRSISCWWTRSRHLYWLHYFHLATPLCRMAIPLGNQSHSFHISVVFIATQGFLILAISSICIFLSAMVRNLKC